MSEAAGLFLTTLSCRMVWSYKHCLWWSPADWDSPVPSQDVHEGGLPGSWGPHDGHQVPAGEFSRDPFEQSFVTWNGAETISVQVPIGSESRSLSSSPRVQVSQLDAGFSVRQYQWNTHKLNSPELWDTFTTLLPHPVHRFSQSVRRLLPRFTVWTFRMTKSLFSFNHSVKHQWDSMKRKRSQKTRLQLLLKTCERL